MAEYIAFEPGVEVNGRSILSTIESIGNIAARVFAKHGIEKIDPQGWYDQQTWLDVLKEIGEQGISLTMVGMSIPQNAEFPPDINGIAAALASIDIAYHMNHRNGEIGSYSYEQISPTHVRITCTNPYPSDLDYGIIYQMALQFAHKGANPIIERAKAPSRQNGDDTCIYDIRWQATND